MPLAIPRVTQPAISGRFFTFSAKISHFLWYDGTFNCVHAFICLCSQQYNCYIVEEQFASINFIFAKLLFT